jgi:cell wall-associated NlpC family hydrolase
VPAPLTPSRSVRSLVVAFIAALVAVIAGLAPATHAYATPNPQEVEAQIDQLWAQLEPLVEQYNGVHDQLNKNLAKQAELTRQLEPLQMSVDLAMTRVGAISAKLYETGPGSNTAALLSAGSPEALLTGLAMLDQIARHQQQAISVTKDQLNQYNQQKAPLDALIAQQRQQDADLAAKKQQIQGQLDQLQKLRTQAYGASGAPGGSLKPVACPVTYIGGAAGKATAYACSKIGSPYQWGAAGQTMFDCSGLTMAAWAAGGVSLGHNTVTQRGQTMSISASALRTGDLVFYGSPAYHVAFYIGGGWVLHAPKPGDKVREAPIAGPGRPSGYGRVNA